jgi:hypothetical protein
MLVRVPTFAAALSQTADRPHKLSGTTLVDGSPVARRVVVRSRNTGNYIISTVSGAFEFTFIPPQTLADPYTVTCFDDIDPTQNALIIDRVYQVDDEGNGPQV